jgi:hypothetical protein
LSAGVRDGVVAGDCEIAPRGEKLLLRVQHVDVDAHADLVAELVGIERALAGHERLLERGDRGDPFATSRKNCRVEVRSCAARSPGPASTSRSSRPLRARAK